MKRKIDIKAMVTECFGLDVDSVRQAWELMSDKQKIIADLLARGMAQGEIAEIMGITTKTVDTHIDRIGERTGVKRMPRLRTLCAASRAVRFIEGDPTRGLHQ